MYISKVKSNNVIVVGGGAAGLSAVLFAMRAGARVTLLEQNEKLGKKIYITGKGRCNATNECDTEAFLSNVPRNPRFLYAALRRLSPSDLRALLRELGCETKVERGGRVFPQSDKASDVTRALARGIEGADIRLRTRVTRIITENGTVRGVSLEDGTVLPADAVIVATGGITYPATGSTGDGFRFAAETGHRVSPPYPALVPLCTRDEWPLSLQGLTLKNIGLSASVRNKTVYCETGELLFTHFGISGPLVLTLSSILSGSDPTEAEVMLDLKPGLSREQLEIRILRDLSENPRKRLSNLLSELLPARLAALFPSLCGVDASKAANQITFAERTRLLNTLKALPLPIRGFRPAEEAVITRGGVDVSEVNPSTMMSKRVEGLFFAGETLDVDAFTGGFNLHIAFATGALAGESAAAFSRRQ